VSQKDFEAFSSQVTASLGSLFEAIKQVANQPKLTLDSDGAHVSNSAPKVEGASQSYAATPPAWRALTDEILGKEFEIELDLPETGGQRFVVYVPLEKSNAGKDHWERHKKDKRLRELGNTGIKGVKDWLLKIRKNLIASGIKLSYYEDTDPRVGISLR
jgi:hypothetical protein